jgi:hypothetical protein
MTTDELERFIDWLVSVVNNSSPKKEVYFTERDLEFSCDENQSRLMVHIFRDFLPVWCDRNSLTIEFPIADIDFSKVISELRDGLARFPGRPPISSAT